jgi:glycosyltransferase involved in cell wall biosynthesis
MRILLVSHPPLSAELGAPQVALNLAAALRDRGHDALAWSPSPLPPDTRGWNLWLRQARAIEEFVESHGPFDVIETPAITASRRLARHGRIVIRSVQPELRYLALDIRADLAYRISPRSLVNAALGLPRTAAILEGWRRAALILCQGSDELVWMRRRFPCWARKLGLYVCALPAGESAALAAVRKNRRTDPAAAQVRFLWIGRWSAQKGIGRLIGFFRRRLISHPGDTLTLAGTGPAAERDLPPEWLVSGQVRIVPSFGRRELPELLAGHDAGLFTSAVEGWGLTLCEMLESGLTVFATEAGAVIDLRPYFPATLCTFPPPDLVTPSPLEDLEATGYRERFSWPAIARSWEEQVLKQQGKEAL